MTGLFRAAWVIARRDYVATVWTRSFLLFLAAPLLPFLFVALASAIDDRADSGPPPPIVVRGAPANLQLLRQARARLTARLGRAWLPPLATAGPAAAPVLAGDPAAPVLSAPPDALEALGGKVGLLVDTARGLRGAPDPVTLQLRVAPDARPDRQEARRELAQGAQTGMVLLTTILAGMLISNLVEEKSSKVIEMLAAAVPIDAIFVGKLAGMLAVSLTGLLLWGTGGIALVVALLPHHALPEPAIGWTAFVGLLALYWMLLYLLLGALYLGIGAQAGSVREVQTLSLPLTVGQLLFFGFAQAAAKHLDAPIGLAAAAVPWSSPFTMVARAAEQPAWWPHVLAIGWQCVCLGVIVRVTARLFRRTVLRSGGAARKTASRSYIKRRGERHE